MVRERCRCFEVAQNPTCERVLRRAVAPPLAAKEHVGAVLEQVLDTRPPCLLGNRDPHLVRELGRELVEAQSGEQADDAPGHPLRYLSQRVVRGGGVVARDMNAAGLPLGEAQAREAIEAAPNGTAFGASGEAW